MGREDLRSADGKVVQYGLWLRLVPSVARQAEDAQREGQKTAGALLHARGLCNVIRGLHCSARQPLSARYVLLWVSNAL